MSHPLNFTEGSNRYQSLISRCRHDVYKPTFDTGDRSSVCEICNSEMGQSLRSTTELAKTIRQLDKQVPQIDEREFTAAPTQEIEDESSDSHEEVQELYLNDETYALAQTPETSFGLEAQSFPEE